MKKHGYERERRLASQYNLMGVCVQEWQDGNHTLGEAEILELLFWTGIFEILAKTLPSIYIYIYIRAVLTKIFQLTSITKNLNDAHEH